jgi:hypothetical protein
MAVPFGEDGQNEILVLGRLDVWTKVKVKVKVKTCAAWDFGMPGDYPRTPSEVRGPIPRHPSFLEPMFH